MAQQKMDELANDVNELRKFSTQATRQRVKDYLSIEVRKLETEITKLREELAKDPQNILATPTTSTTTGTSKRYEVELTQFAFDESNRFAKIYVAVNGVQNCPEEAVTVDFTDNSFCLKIKDLNNRDYKLETTKLVAAIDPSKSYRKIKSNLVAIYAKKVVENPWDNLTQTEKLLKGMKDSQFSKDVKEANNDGDDKDPSAGLMDMMKKMYDSGNPEMKQMIAKAWSEGEQKKRAGGGSEVDMMGAMGGLGGMAGLGGAMGGLGGAMGGLGGGMGGFPGMQGL